MSRRLREMSTVEQIVLVKSNFVITESSRYGSQFRSLVSDAIRFNLCRAIVEHYMILSFEYLTQSSLETTEESRGEGQSVNTGM